MRTPTPPPPLRALPEDVGVQGEASRQSSGSQRQAGPQRVQRRLPPAVQKLRGPRGGQGSVRGPRRGHGGAGWGSQGRKARGSRMGRGATRGEDGGNTARKGRGLRGGGAAKGRALRGRGCQGAAPSRSTGGKGAGRGAGRRRWRRVEGVIGGKPDVARIHLWIQLAEGRARPAEQTQLQARQQRQGQKAVRDLKRGRGVSGPELRASPASSRRRL